ncbi:hypothetical protein ACH4TV_42370 [Streptomyces sp. NPDC020898]|uniref:hypothetical protein n=1 Tax=Streptomyces sp. NPDC020898 TaxID=3365101 RepID=UPI0037B02306
MVANVGAALSMLTRPEQYPDIRFAARLRDSVIDSVTRPVGMEEARDTGRASAVPAAAATLAAEPPQALTAVESALLQQWLGTLADSGEPARSNGARSESA